LGVRIYWLSQKEALHVDEGLSLVASCYKDYMISKDYEYNHEYTGEQIKKITLCEEGGLKNVWEDVRLLRIENRDPPHTNFYYSLLRIALGELKTGNINEFIFRGGFLNLLLFTVSFFVFFLLMRNLFSKNKIIPYIAVFCTFLSTATISNTLFLRYYQLQEMLFILFIYTLYRFMNTQNKIITLDKKLYVSPFPVGVMILVTALTLLSGYYAVFLLFFWGLYIGYQCISQKNIKELGMYILILLCAILLVMFLYLPYKRGFFSERAIETKGKLVGDVFFSNLKISGETILTILNDYYFTVPVLLVIITAIAYLYVSKSKFSISVFASFIFVAAIAYTIIVTCLAPVKTLRYAMPVFPFLIILPLLLLQSIKSKKAILFLSVAFCISFSLNALNVDKIKYLFKDKPKQYLFTQSLEIPVLIINRSYWMYADLIPYLHDKQKYIFSDQFDFDITAYNQYYIVVTKDLISEINIDSNWYIADTFDSEFFTGMKVCRNKIQVESFE
jgi:hypothetical protein